MKRHISAHRKKNKSSLIWPLVITILILCIAAVIFILLKPWEKKEGAGQNLLQDATAASQDNALSEELSQQSWPSQMQDTNNTVTAGTGFSQPVPKSDWVGRDYFSDAVFIGDSITTGITVYDFMENTTVYAEKGINPKTIYEKPVVKQDGENCTIMDAVKNKAGVKKMYVLLGSNGIEWMDTASFSSSYAKLIDDLKSYHPDAMIYVQSIFPITAHREEQNAAEGKDFNKVKIDAFNQSLQQLAEEKQVYYLAVNTALEGEDGYLPADSSPDGVHLTASYYQKWFDYLRTHTAQQSS